MRDVYKRQGYRHARAAYSSAAVEICEISRGVIGIYIALDPFKLRLAVIGAAAAVAQIGGKYGKHTVAY